MGQQGGRRVGHQAVVHGTAPAQHGDRIRIGHHFAELVRDDDDRALAATGKCAHMAQHLIGLLGRQHRRGFVQNQQARFEVQLLEQFELLLFASGELAWAGVQIQAERGACQERQQFGTLGAPVNHPRHFAGGQHQVLGHGHARRQREVLVDHANTQGPRHDRVGNGLLPPVDQNAAFLRLLKPGHTFHQRAFARSVFPQQGMHRAGLHLHADLVHGGEGTKPFGQLVGLQRQRAGGRFGGGNQVVVHEGA